MIIQLSKLGRKAYQEIADVFIQVEKDIYASMLWEGFQPFEIEKSNNYLQISKLSQLNLLTMI